MHHPIRWFGVAMISLTVLALDTGVVLAQRSAPARRPDSDRDVIKLDLKGKEVSLDYGRPQLKGRDMLSMAPDGFVWRFGMDTSTTFKTVADLSFGDRKLPKGTYSAWIKHITGDKWSLIFNSEVGVWGLPGAKRIHDVLEVPLTYSREKKSIERMTVELTNRNGKGYMRVAWGAHRLETTFRVD